MYGMMPSEKMAQFSSAPPLKMLNKAATEPDDCVSTWFLNHWWSTAASTPGRGDLRAHPHDDDHEQGKEDPGPEFGAPSTKLAKAVSMFG